MHGYAVLVNLYIIMKGYMTRIVGVHVTGWISTVSSYFKFLLYSM